MRALRLVLPVAAAALGPTATALADHIPGAPCIGCASHAHWPRIDGVIRQAKGSVGNFTGTGRSDQLMGHHGSDVLRGGGGSDVLWGDWDRAGQPATQRDVIHGGGGNDFVYGSHGRNVIRGGRGNDAISAHYGNGVIDCGPGRDVYHVARTRRHRYKVRNCERVDYRSEAQRGGGLKPLP